MNTVRKVFLVLLAIAMVATTSFMALTLVSAQPGTEMIAAGHPATGACAQTTWGSDQLIEDNAGFDGYAPQIAMDGCRVVAVWFQHDGTSWSIYSNWSSDGGATWGSDQLIEDNAGHAYYPQVP